MNFININRLVFTGIHIFVIEIQMLKWTFVLNGIPKSSLYNFLNSYHFKEAISITFIYFFCCKFSNPTCFSSLNITFYHFNPKKKKLILNFSSRERENCLQQKQIFILKTPFFTLLTLENWFMHFSFVIRLKHPVGLVNICHILYGHLF